MILRHPLKKENDINKKAIEKYKDRLVKVSRMNDLLWLSGKNEWSNDKKEAIEITFKEALKSTKYFSVSSQIQYHFSTNLGESTPNIKDFDQEEVYNCPTVKFDEYKNEGGKL